MLLCFTGYSGRLEEKENAAVLNVYIYKSISLLSEQLNMFYALYCLKFPT